MIIALLTAIFMVFPVNAQTPQPYSFTVAGHTYGRDDFFSIEQVTDFMVYTGDVVADGCTDWPEFHSDRNRYNGTKEHHIAPGNHDADNLCPENFENEGYSKYYSFMKEGDRHIILDGNRHGWSIRGVQKTWLLNELAAPSRNVFLYVHQPIWEDTTGFGGRASWRNNSNAGRILPLLYENWLKCYVSVNELTV